MGSQGREPKPAVIGRNRLCVSAPDLHLRDQSNRPGDSGTESTEAMSNQTSGYCDCACRDCFQLTIGVKGVEMCDGCETAGCDTKSECNRPGAYGVEGRATITRTDVSRWMWIHVDEHVDATCNVVNGTALAEAAADEFDAYYDHVDFDIPEWVFELAEVIGSNPRFNQ
jgi:hypothetical protein